MLLTIPSLGYMGTTFAAFFLLVSVTGDVNVSVVAVLGQYQAILQQMRRWNVAFDVLFLVDAICTWA